MFPLNQIRYINYKRIIIVNAMMEIVIDIFYQNCFALQRPWKKVITTTISAHSYWEL